VKSAASAKGCNRGRRPVGEDCEDEDGLHLGEATDFDLRQSSDRLGPAEDFFDAFADDLSGQRSVTQPCGRASLAQLMSL
jgi:hypothetical protein